MDTSSYVAPFSEVNALDTKTKANKLDTKHKRESVAKLIGEMKAQERGSKSMYSWKDVDSWETVRPKKSRRSTSSGRPSTASATNPAFVSPAAQVQAPTKGLSKSDRNVFGRLADLHSDDSSTSSEESSESAVEHPVSVSAGSAVKVSVAEEDEDILLDRAMCAARMEADRMAEKKNRPKRLLRDNKYYISDDDESDNPEDVLDVEEDPRLNFAKSSQELANEEKRAKQAELHKKLVSAMRNKRQPAARQSAVLASEEDGWQIVSRRKERKNRSSGNEKKRMEKIAVPVLNEEDEADRKSVV